jgi:hypothetical protein
MTEFELIIGQITNVEDRTYHAPIELKDIESDRKLSRSRMKCI